MLNESIHWKALTRLSHYTNNLPEWKFRFLANDDEGIQRMSMTPVKVRPDLEAGISRRDPKKAAMSGWIGGALEYYDFALYSLAATLIFPSTFFPSEIPTVAIIASLAT